MRGRFITLEGGEGAGKSTQAALLAERLREAGVSVVVSREPGGSPLAERLRVALTGPAGASLSAQEQAVLFAAARADHVESVIAPALSLGTWVICDRFFDSTEAYQGSAGAAPGVLAALRQVAVGPHEPDLTLVVDIAPDVGLERARSRDALDRFEQDALSTQETRRSAFLAIAAREPKRCAVIDGNRDHLAVAADIWRIVSERLSVHEAA